MNTNRTLGLLAALLVTAVQAAVLAVDSRGAAATDEVTPSHYDARLGPGAPAEAQLGYRITHGRIVG